MFDIFCGCFLWRNTFNMFVSSFTVWSKRGQSQFWENLLATNFANLISENILKAFVSEKRHVFVIKWVHWSILKEFFINLSFAMFMLKQVLFYDTKHQQCDMLTWCNKFSFTHCQVTCHIDVSCIVSLTTIFLLGNSTVNHI